MFVYSFIHLFTDSLIYSFIHSLIYSFIHLFDYWFIGLFVYSFIRLFVYSFIRLFVYLANHEPGTPELQIYEIPLDSLGHQRVYIGTKRVAPKTDEHKETVKFTRTKKQRKKEKHEYQGNTLPRTGRRDHIYSSVNDEVSSTLSEGMRKAFYLVN